MMIGLFLDGLINIVRRMAANSKILERYSNNRKEAIVELVQEVTEWNKKWEKWHENPQSHWKPPDVEALVTDLEKEYSVGFKYKTESNELNEADTKE